MLVLGASVALLSGPAIAEPPDATATPAEAQPASVVQPASQQTATDQQAPAEPAPAEPLAVQPAADQPAKMVRLGFQGQEWLPVLEWLAKTRGLNLDWQKMPEGILNLSSAREYSVEEAEDLINMQLLVRGFTLLQRGEVLHVAPLENIDITMVPKVDAQELAKLPRHQYVRVTFPLKWMIAEEAANEFKPLISPYGKLFPMASANRLEAMDAVVNLRELHRLLTNSEADEGRRERVAVFPIKNRKAGEVAVQVRQLLGLPAAPEAAATATQMQLDIEQAKYRAEAVKQLGANAQPLLKDKPDVHLVVNDKENSILVNGRPDKIEIARQAIEAMDKPLPPSESPWESVNRVKVYEIAGFDPITITQLVENLKERGNLSKETRIQHEVTYNRLVVFASPADQVTIANVISGFRTQGRRAEVLQLSRIDPQYASKAALGGPWGRAGRTISD
jgi:type II secretory pathway component GspD/PulD (secretin)